MSKKRNRQGFSIVEVAIALSVIVIISISALSIVLSSITTKSAVINKTEAQNFANNVWESFKAAETEEEFLSLVTFAEGITLTLPESEPGEIGSPDYIYSSEEKDFTVEIWVTFPAPEIEDPENDSSNADSSVPETQTQTETDTNTSVPDISEPGTPEGENTDTENTENWEPKNEYAELKIRVTDNNAKEILEFSYHKGYKTWD